MSAFGILLRAPAGLQQLSFAALAIPVTCSRAPGVGVVDFFTPYVVHPVPVIRAVKVPWVAVFCFPYGD